MRFREAGMDMRMPEMDGLDATRIIRDPNSAVLNHQIPVIAMTVGRHARGLRAVPGSRHEWLCQQARIATGLDRSAEHMVAIRKRDTFRSSVVPGMSV